MTLMIRAAAAEARTRTPALSYDDLPVTVVGESTARTKEGVFEPATPAPCHEAKEYTKNEGVARRVTLEGGT